MTRKISISLNGKDYVWMDSEWYEAQSFISLPQIIIRELNRQLEHELQAEDANITTPGVLVERAMAARDAQQYHRAEVLIRRALHISPSSGAAAVLCSILWAVGRPQRALDETDAFKREAHPALLTSRAAALCDLHRWEEARREVGRALAIAKSEEAFNVVNRIKAVRPDLYKKTG